MAAIRYRVPYELAVQARDLASGRPVTNLFYLRSALQATAPPVYGTPIQGNGSTATLVSNFQGLWSANILPVLNNRYQMIQFVMRAIIGKRFGTPLLAIAGLVTGAPVTIQTSAPHGFSTGNTIIVTGVSVPGTVNANWVITVVNPSTFTLNGSNIAGVWSGDGMVQRVLGAIQLLYADQEVLLNAGVGTVLGDSLPLFATSSVRRLNGGVGRHFRSRVSLSPMSEIDVVNGGFTAAQRANMATALGAINVGIINGGTAADSGLSFSSVFARAIALSLPSPFSQSDTFVERVTSYVQQRNAGSLVRRKPRLTSIIT